MSYIIVCGFRQGAGGGDQRRHHNAARSLLPGLCRGRPGCSAGGFPGKVGRKGMGLGDFGEAKWINMMGYVSLVGKLFKRKKKHSFPEAARQAIPPMINPMGN